jgi:hypothetical protein
MTDVPSHSWLLPTLLEAAGVRFLHLGCNAGSATPRVPPLFWWEGPDGSRLLTMYSESYGSDLFPPAGWNHRTWLAMLMRGDNQGPPGPDEVKQVIARVNAKLPGVNVQVGTLDTFAAEILKENLGALPVICQDMPDTWVHGPMCNPDGVTLAREAMPALFAAESLHSLLNTWKVTVPDPFPAIADGYENSLLFYEHTWGGALSWFTRILPPRGGLGQCDHWDYGAKFQADLKAGRFARLLASWEEHTDYARQSRRLAFRTLGDGLQSLAGAVNRAGPRNVVFNPLPWKRSAVVNGAVIRDIPAGGYTTVVSAGPKTADAPPATILENAVFKVEADPARGAIRSLVDKRSGRELIDSAAPHGFGQHLYERFSPGDVARYTKAYVRGGHDWAIAEIGKPNMPSAAEAPYRAATPGPFTVSARTTGITKELEMRAEPQAGGFPYPVALRLQLHGDEPHLDIALTIKKPADNWPEAGWICLPFKVEAPQFRVGRNGFIMDPAKDIIAGANRYLYAAGTGVAVFDATGRGAGVCGPDTPLVSLGEPGGWKFDHDYIPTKPVIYFNLFNNQWSTNYRLWNEGQWTYRFRVWAFDNYDAGTALITPSLEMRYPVQVSAATDAPAGNLPPERTGLSLSRPGVLVTTFGRNPDGPGTLLRLWEQTGASGECIVTLPVGMQVHSAHPVNLRGERMGSALPVSNGAFRLTLKRFAPASFLLE